MLALGNENVMSNSMVTESEFSLLNSTDNVSQSNKIEEEMVEQN